MGGVKDLQPADFVATLDAFAFAVLDALLPVCRLVFLLNAYIMPLKGNTAFNFNDQFYFINYSLLNYFYLNKLENYFT